MAVLTLLDIAKMNGNDGLVGLVDEAARATPELTGIDAFNGGRQIPNVAASRTMQGLFYKTLVRTALPTVGFRGANEGVQPTKSTYENRLVETFTVNPRWNVDVAVADKHEDGVAALMAQEADGHLTSGLMTVAKQFYYGTGTGGDAKGFPGLLASVDAGMVVDAAGTTDNVASSVWGVKFGPKFAQWVYGNNGQFRLSDMDIRDVLDAAGNPYSAYFQELFAHVGLQVMNKFSISRIKKLTTDSTKGLTDDLVAQLIAKHPVGYKPDVLFMSRRSLQQLQDSRTATTTTGAPAPFPMESHGVPIIATDNILDTETLAL